MIRVRIFVVFYNRLITIALPDETMPVDQLIPALERRLNLPYIEYVIKKEGKDEPIPRKKTLRDLGIKNDNVLVFDFLRPEEQSAADLPPVEGVPSEMDYSSASGAVSGSSAPGTRLPVWLMILILVILVFLCVSMLMILRSWDVYR